MDTFENYSAYDLMQTYNHQMEVLGGDSHTDHTDYDDHCDHNVDDYDNATNYHVDSDEFGGTHDDADGDLSGCGFGHDDN